MKYEKRILGAVEIENNRKIINHQKLPYQKHRCDGPALQEQ